MQLSSHATRRAATSAKSLASHITSHTQSSTSSSIGHKQYLHWPRARCSQSYPGNPHKQVAGSGKDCEPTRSSDVAGQRFYHGEAARYSSRPQVPMSPRRFMLICRLGRQSPRLVSVVDRRSLCGKSMTRTYASTAVAAVDPDPETDTTTRNADLQQDLARDGTSLEQQDEYVELSLGSNAPSAAFGEDSKPRVLLIRGNLDAAKARIADETAELIKEKKRAFERELRDRGDGISWDSVAEKLEKRTASELIQTQDVALRGAEDVLIDLYHRFLHNPAFDVEPAYPLCHFGSEGRMQVRGSDRSILKVKEYLYDQRLSRTVKMRRAHPEHHSAAWRVRHVDHHTRPEDIHIPSTWSVRSFAEYARVITISRPPRALTVNPSYEDRAETLLLQLVKSPEMRSVFSWGALYEILSFLVKYRKIPQAWQFMDLVEEAGFPPTVSFYNVFLFFYANEQNAAAYDGVLTRMRREGVRPDALTWVSLVLASPTVELKQHNMRRMIEKGLSAETAFQRHTPPTIIPYSFRAFLDSGGSLRDYVEILDEVWGRQWLSPTGVRHLVDVLGSRGSILEAVRFIDDLRTKRDYQPTSRDLHILLKHCVRTKTADLAVWLVAHCTGKWAWTAVDRITLESMFKLVSTARMYNLTRILWIYACLRGQTTDAMRRYIYRSLLSRSEPRENTVHGRWRSSVGTVACRKDPIASGQTAADILTEQQRLFETSRPKRPFVKSMTEALFLDKDWEQQGVKYTRGTTWMLVNAIQVPTGPSIPIESTKPVRIRPSYSSHRRTRGVSIKGRRPVAFATRAQRSKSLVRGRLKVRRRS